jgi:hypothetical protein
MIYRHQRIVFWCLVGCIVAMGLLLFFERESGRERVARLADRTPLDAPTSTTEPITLDLANDSDGTVTASVRQIALPSEVNARCRALIDHLIAEYAEPGSAHPLQSGAAVNEVFLVPLPVVGHTAAAGADTSSLGSPNGRRATSLVASTDPNALQPHSPGGELAIVDLHSTFADHHPAGVEVESLTILSILGTLHANLPQIEQVRFLVDGQPRETLAGHADLLRTYPTRDTTSGAR